MFVPHSKLYTNSLAVSSFTAITKAIDDLLATYKITYQDDPPAEDANSKKK